jgi:hypothetical protein
MSDEPTTMSMRFPVLCWDCEKTLTDGNVRELDEHQIQLSGSVGQPAVKVRRIVRMVCEFCYDYVHGPARTL